MQGTELVKFSYDTSGRRSGMTLPNGIAATYGYDVAGNITSMDYKASGGASVGNLTYGYDASGLRTSVGGSLASSNLDAATSQANVFDANARQTSSNGTTLTYDADGNMTFDGTRTFTWNGRGQLTKVSMGGSVVTSYTYDALGRRRTVTSGTDTTSFDYDGIDVVAERKGSDLAPVLTGLGTDERYARGKTGQRSYLLTDAIGSTVATTGQAGSITQRYDYAAYGARPGVPAADNAFQYAGREADSSGLVYMRARYYSPSLGRFVSEDPIREGGGLNGYAYVGGNPVLYRDPQGLLVPEAIVGGIIGAAFNIGAGLLSGDCGNQLWADAGAGFLTGFAIGLTDGASLIAGGGFLDTAAVSGARGLFSSGVEAARQLANSGGSNVNWWGVGAAGLGSGAGDWMGSQVGAANALSGLGRSLMQEQAAGGWFGGLVGGSAGTFSDAAEKEGY